LAIARLRGLCQAEGMQTRIYDKLTFANRFTPPGAEADVKLVEAIVFGSAVNGPGIEFEPGADLTETGFVSKADLARLRAEFEQDLIEIRNDVAMLKAQMVTRLYALSIAQTALVVAVLVPLLRFLT